MSQSAPIRVLHVFGTMNRGGAELRTVDVMTRLDRRDVALDFLALSGQAGVLDDELVAAGAQVHHCALDRGFVPRMLQLLRRERYDAVHSHVFLTSAGVLAVARAAGVRQRIAHFRSTDDGQPDTPRRRAYRATMSRLLDLVATDIVGVSAGCLSAAWSPRWATDPRCRIIYNGVDPARFVLPDAARAIRAELGLAPATRLLVQVGRLNRVKNHRFTAELIPHLPPDIHVALVGRGDNDIERDVRARLAANGGASRVHFVGERDATAPWFAGADLSLLPSTTEGLPGVVIESLAAGTPVLASDLPGVREIAARVDGVTAIDPARGPAAWALAIASLLAVGTTVAARTHLRASHAASPFVLSSAAAAHRALWRSPRGEAG